MAGRRLALVLANGAYTARAPLSKTVPTAAALREKLEAMGFEVVYAADQDLAGMRAAVAQFVGLLERAADSAEAAAGAAQAPRLLLFFAFCGHGCAGRFFPVDCPRGAPPEASFCFFDDLVIPLYRVLGGCDDCGRRFPNWRRGTSRGLLGIGGGGECDQGEGDPPAFWRLPGSARLIFVIESCRRLTSEERKAFQEEKQRVANGRRHLLPSLVAMRPDLANVGGADWDASRLSFLSRLGPSAPQLLLALSSESTTASYDCVFLRSITEAVDKPVRLWGILERASHDTLRRTGHKQRPVLLSLGCGARGLPGPGGEPQLQDLVLAAAPRAQSAEAAFDSGGLDDGAAYSGKRHSYAGPAEAGCPEPRCGAAPAPRRVARTMSRCRVQSPAGSLGAISLSRSGLLSRGSSRETRASLPSLLM